MEPARPSQPRLAAFGCQTGRLPWKFFNPFHAPRYTTPSVSPLAPGRRGWLGIQFRPRRMGGSRDRVFPPTLDGRDFGELFGAEPERRSAFDAIQLGRGAESDYRRCHFGAAKHPGDGDFARRAAVPGPDCAQ